MKQDALHVGFIGLGHMGHGMAVNIVKHGFPLQVMAHRSRNAIDDLVQRGAREVSSSQGHGGLLRHRYSLRAWSKGGRGVGG